jgi:hypothetical protein
MSRLLLALATSAMAETVWYAEYGLSVAQQDELAKRGCYRGTFSESLSLSTCKSDSSVRIAALPDDAFLCLAELTNSSVLTSSKDILKGFSDAHAVFEDASHLLIGNAVAVTERSDACDVEAYGGLAVNIIPVARHPVQPQAPINWAHRAVQRAFNQSSLGPDPLIQSMVDAYSQADVTNYLKLISTNGGSNEKITRNSYSIGIGKAGCADSTWRCAFHAVDYIENEVNNIMAEFPGEWQVERVPFRNDMCPNIVVTIDGISRDKVIIGAHMDSRNTGSGPTATGVAPGADDNGSGTAAMLAILKAMAAASIHKEVQFQYTIQLMWFCGEEQGLLGSDFIARKMRSEGATVVGMFNNDMIGYTDSRYGVVCSFMKGYSTAWLSESCKTFAGVYVPKLKTGDTTGCCSDQQSFFNQGFPAAGIFETPTSSVVYPRYHQTGDTFDNGLVNFQQVFQFGQANYACILEYAVPSQVRK